MKAELLLALLLVPLVVAGCSAEFPLRWKPSEPQKQAADVAAKGARELKGKVHPAAEPIRAEVQQGTEITRAYMGVPKNPREPAAVGNQAILSQAAVDAARPPPTAGELATELAKELERGTQAGLGLAEVLLGAAASIAGTWGATKAARKIAGWREQTVAAQANVAQTSLALQQVAAGIDQLPSDVRQQVKDLQKKHQTEATAKLIAGVRIK